MAQPHSHMETVNLVIPGGSKPGIVRCTAALHLKSSRKMLPDKGDNGMLSPPRVAMTEDELLQPNQSLQWGLLPTINAEQRRGRVPVHLHSCTPLLCAISCSRSLWWMDVITFL